MNEISDHEPFRPVLRTQADLEHAWRHLMEPLGFSRSSTWMMLIEADDRPQRRLVEIDECELPPEPQALDHLAEVARLVLDDLGDLGVGARWAFLRSRPGGSTVTAIDRAWAHGITAACRAAGVPTEVVHLATDVDLVPLPYDELAGTSGLSA